MAETTRTWERLNVAADQAVGALRKLIHEGNVRRILVKNAQGRTLLDLPVTAGAVGALLAPAWMAVGAAAALVGGLTIDIEREEEAAAPGPGASAPQPPVEKGAGGREAPGKRPPSA